METETFSILRVNLFKHSEKSFIAALDEASIPHGRIQIFTSCSQASAIIEVISALSKVMPWNTISKVIVAWIKAKSSREVMITSEDGTIFQARGHSPSEVNKVLTSSVDLVVIDSSPGNET